LLLFIHEHSCESAVHLFVQRLEQQRDRGSARITTRICHRATTAPCTQRPIQLLLLIREHPRQSAVQLFVQRLEQQRDRGSARTTTRICHGATTAPCTQRPIQLLLLIREHPRQSAVQLFVQRLEQQRDRGSARITTRISHRATTAPCIQRPIQLLLFIHEHSCESAVQRSVVHVPRGFALLVASAVSGSSGHGCRG
jgi:hypothetical protein